MANIIEILGTDSVSASRPTINTNFELLNDELASVMALLNPTTLALSGVSSVTTTSLTVSSGTTNLLSVANAGGIQALTDASFSNAITLGGTLVKSGVVGSMAIPTTVTSPTALTAITYFVESAFNLPTATDGQEITLISTSASEIDVLPQAGAAIGATSIKLDAANSTITLRCFNDVWYIISSHACTIA